MRLQPLIAVALTTLAAGITLAAADSEKLTAQQILAKTAENYRGTTGYAFSGNVATHMLINDQAQDVQNTLKVYYGGPGRTHFEAGTANDRTMLLTARDSTIAYSSALGQYTVSPVTVQPAAAGGLPALDPGAAHPFAGYARLADHVTDARLVGRDTATVNGRTVPTFVVEVSYDTTVVPTLPSGQPQKPKRLHIDAEKFLVLRDDTSFERVHPALPKPIVIEQSARYTSVAWNAAPPESLFAFVPPAGAVRVAQMGQSAPVMDENSPLVGKPADDFTLPDLKGVKRALSSHKGKVVLLDFWATWCGPCRREMPIIEKLHGRFAKKGLVVYGVNCSESSAKAKAFVAKYAYTFPQLLDHDGSVQARYQITAIPTVFIVDKQGTVRAHLIGGRSEDELVAALAKAGLDTRP
jgi:thiol-disulfide isomerase/thioredoxin